MTTNYAQMPDGHDPRPNAELIGEFWDVLVKPGDTHEIRIPKSRRGPARLYGTTSGYFSEREAAIRAISPMTGLDAPGVYITLNPVNPDLRARANNRLESGIKAATADSDVMRRCHLLLDFDPNRPSGTSATDAERGQALSLRDAVEAFLTDIGWPSPVAKTMSGNGGGLIYRIDLPNDDSSTTLVIDCLASLGEMFNTTEVDIDQTVYNAARITKVLGTVAAKGDNCPDLGRFWRVAAGTTDPDAEVVPPDLLAKLAHLRVPAEKAVSRRSSAHNAPNRDAGARAWRVAEVLARNGIGWHEEHRPYGVVYRLDRCLTSTSHGDGAAIIEFASGALTYRCHHNSCRGKGWNDARSALGLAVSMAVTGKAGTLPTTEQDMEPSPEPWRLPVPFDAYTTPPFPLTVLPAWLAEYVGALAVETQTPIDLAGLLGIAVLATAAARRAVVVVRDGWTEPLNVYVLAVLPPGTRKSAVFDAMTEPILNYERDLANTFTPKVAAAEQAHRLAEARLKAAETAAVKAQSGETDVLIAEARTRREELDQISVLVLPQLIADDVTAEALTRLLFDHRERMAIFSAEGDLFEIMAGRYSDGGGNFAVYLKGHAGDMLKVNRIGRTGDYVRHPALTLAITAQPSVLEGLARKDGFRSKGLLARPIYALPVSLVGRRDAEAPPMPASVRMRYHEIVRSLISKLDPPDAIEAAPLTTPEPIRLRFDRSARQRLVAFMDVLEPRLGPEGDLCHVADWAGKLAGLVARVAGQLHLGDNWDVSHPARCLVSQETVDRAITFGEYALGHALAAFGTMGADAATDDAKRLWLWIAKRGMPALRRAEAYQALRGQFPKSADLDAPLKLLEEYGYIRPITLTVDRHSEGRRGPQGRPPGATYDVNPLAMAQGAENAEIPGKGSADGRAEDSQHFQVFQRPETSPQDLLSSSTASDTTEAPLLNLTTGCALVPATATLRGHGTTFHPGDTVDVRV